jgi:Helitron helicase-like domain at N-terminus
LQDVNDAIDYTRFARGSITQEIYHGRQLLGAIDTMCRTIPHTNEAAKKARRQVECLQHHFGSPTFFLTVTPDDDNHMLVQIYAGHILNGAVDVNEQSDESVLALSKEKTNLRIKFPGVCAFFFDIALDLVIHDVLGWDKQKKERLEDVTGIFGPLDALSVSIEEQGRRTLHAHILVWVSATNNEREMLHSSSRQKRKRAQEWLEKQIDTICSTKCFFNGLPSNQRRTFFQAFRHQCSDQAIHSQQSPKLVSDQLLRNLRCQQHASEHVAYCSSCSATWTSTELVSSYLKHLVKLPHASGIFDQDIKRLKNLATQFQLAATDNEALPTWIIDAGYNHHFHTTSCFKQTKCYSSQQKARECRYRYPQRKKNKTRIVQASPTKQAWYLWNGQRKDRHVREVCLKRGKYDIFQNTCCPHISYSKLACNTNVSFVMPGALAQYCVNYTTKNTQKDDTKEYEGVRNAADRILSKVQNSDTPSGVAIRRLLAATYTHQSNNVLGAAMDSTSLMILPGALCAICNNYLMEQMFQQQLLFTMLQLGLSVKQSITYADLMN